MGVKVKHWKGAYWLFINHNGRRKARRVGAGAAGHRAANVAAICDCRVSGALRHSPRIDVVPAKAIHTNSLPATLLPCDRQSAAVSPRP